MRRPRARNRIISAAPGPARSATARPWSNTSTEFATMTNLDATTMVLVLALGNLALCALLTFFDNSPSRPAGFGGSAMAAWSLSKQVQAGAWTLLALGGAGVVPEPLALPGGYALLFAGVAIE